MTQHILLEDNLKYISSFFSDTGISHTAHVLAIVSGDGYPQRGNPGPEEHCQTAAKKAFLTAPKKMGKEFKGYRSTRNYQSEELQI